jgi:hypothetical protein
MLQRRNQKLPLKQCSRKALLFKEHLPSDILCGGNAYAAPESSATSTIATSQGRRDKC